MNNIVLDASAGVEMLLLTPTGRRLLTKLPADPRTWVPEVYFTEVAGVLRRHEMHGRYDATRIRLAFDRLVSTPMSRVQDATSVPGRLHHVCDDGTKKVQVAHMHGVVASLGKQPGDARRHRLVDKEPQPAEASGSSRSSTAAAA